MERTCLLWVRVARRRDFFNLSNNGYAQEWNFSLSRETSSQIISSTCGCSRIFCRVRNKRGLEFTGGYPQSIKSISVVLIAVFAGMCIYLASDLSRCGFAIARSDYSQRISKRISPNECEKIASTIELPVKYRAAPDASVNSEVREIEKRRSKFMRV